MASVVAQAEELLIVDAKIINLSTRIAQLEAQGSVPIRVPALNAAIAKLHRLELWWYGLSSLQRRLPSFCERLVIDTESIISSEREQLTQLRELPHRDEQ